MAVSRRQCDIRTDSIWLLYPISGGAFADGAPAWPDGAGGINPRPCHGPCHLWIGFTTLFFRNYYVTIPIELVKAAKVDGASSSEFFLNLSALVPANNCCHGDLAIYPDLE